MKDKDGWAIFSYFTILIILSGVFATMINAKMVRLDHKVDKSLHEMEQMRMMMESDWLFIINKNNKPILNKQGRIVRK